MTYEKIIWFHWNPIPYRISAGSFIYVIIFGMFSICIYIYIYTTNCSYKWKIFNYYIKVLLNILYCYFSKGHFAVAALLQYCKEILLQYCCNLSVLYGYIILSTWFFCNKTVPKLFLHASVYNSVFSNFWLKILNTRLRLRSDFSCWSSFFKTEMKRVFF